MLTSEPDDPGFLIATASRWIRDPAPSSLPCAHLDEAGLEGLFFESIPFRNKPTRVFAWLGLPDGASAADPVPGIVLVHGGGGTAFARWVRWWNRQGFAAIAMDTCGAMPLPDTGIVGSAEWPRHSHSGPPGWGSFDQMDWPVEDQWGTHACAAVIRAHSLLAARPEVDAARTGIAGISWGGYLTCLVAGLDPRFKAVNPIYGCGYVSYDSTWTDSGMLTRLPGAQAEFWRTTFDPAAVLPRITAPTLWLTGTNDFAYWPPIWQRSAAATAGPHRLCMKLRMPHGHMPASEEARESVAFFKEHLAGGAPMLSVNPPHVDSGCMSASYDDERPLRGATLIMTPDACRWPEREWHALPADIDPATRRVTAAIPAEATAAYLCLLSEDWLTTTTDIVFRAS